MKKYQVVGIGNAMVDVLARAEDAFLLMAVAAIAVRSEGHLQHIDHGPLVFL